MLSFKLGFVIVLWISVLIGLMSKSPDENSNEANESTPINLPDESNMPSAGWAKMFDDDIEPLINYPAISILSYNGKTCRVLVRNQGVTTLQYEGYDANTPSIYQETWMDDKWHCGDWSWCGTGIEQFRLPPKRAVILTFSFRSRKTRERIFVDFAEKGTQRASLVLLAAEP